MRCADPDRLARLIHGLEQKVETERTLARPFEVAAGSTDQVMNSRFKPIPARQRFGKCHPLADRRIGDPRRQWLERPSERLIEPGKQLGTDTVGDRTAPDTRPV